VPTADRSTLFHSVSYDGTFLSPLIKGGRGVVKRKVWKKSLVTNRVSPKSYLFYHKGEQNASRFRTCQGHSVLKYFRIPKFFLKIPLTK
jgi:hypothetical protein